jgi:hypothetical protein
MSEERPARPVLVALLLLGCAGAGASRTPPGTPAPPAAAEAAPTGTDPSAIEQTALNRLVVAGVERMRPCYRRELASDPDLERKMAIRLYVTPAGKVADMRLMDAYEEREPERKSALTDAIARCLGKEVMTWAFPATTWEGEVEVFHPPVFLANFSAEPIEPEKGDPAKQRIRRVISSRNAEYRDCYDAYLDRGGPADRKTLVKTSIRVRNEGVVEDVTVLEPTVLEPRFRDCLVGAVRGLRFGKLPGDGYLVVEYPFVFTPGR